MAKASNKKTMAQAVKVVVMPHGQDLPLPRYQTTGAAGMDLVAAVPAGKAIKIKSGGFALVPTGLMIELPAGMEAQVRPRSGLAAKHGVTVLNAPGTIDSDYRGEVQVILINHGSKTFVVQRGERIAQMIIAPVTQVAMTEVKVVSDTERGTGGFGSTGVAAASSSGKAAKTAKAVKPAKAKLLTLKKAPGIAFPRRSVKSPSPRRR